MHPRSRYPASFNTQRDIAQVVAALQAHAAEVSELAQDGMAAMMRGAQAAMRGRR